MLTVLICILIGFGFFYFTRPERVPARVVVSSPLAIIIVVISGFLGFLISVILGALFADGYYSKVFERRLEPIVSEHQVGYLNTSLVDEKLCIGFAFLNNKNETVTVNFSRMILVLVASLSAIFISV